MLAVVVVVVVGGGGGGGLEWLRVDWVEVESVRDE
jgi:hypothetical protein